MTYPKIFVAGCWEKRKEIGIIIKRFEEIVDITHDWTVHEDESLFTNESYLKCQAILDADGLDRADYLVVIMDKENYPYMGTWTEIGMAISNGIGILLYNPVKACMNNVYIRHPLVKNFDSLNEIAEYLKKV